MAADATSTAWTISDAALLTMIPKKARWTMNNCMAYWSLEMIGAPDFMAVRFPQHRRDWKKSQKKIRRERRRRMAYRKGKVRK